MYALHSSNQRQLTRVSQTGPLAIPCSAFISIGYSRYNCTRGMVELESLFSGQWRNGLLPHIVFNKATPPGSYFPGPRFWLSTVDSLGEAPVDVNTSGIIQPPVHPIAVKLLVDRADQSERTKAAGFLERMFPKLELWMEYLYSERDPDENGLVYIRHPWESGMDNSPIWDTPMAGIPFEKSSIPKVS